MISWKSLMYLALLGLWSSAGLGVESAVPTPLSPDHLASMRERCPFALATVTAIPAAPQASFAANWYVSGIGRIDDKDFVTIKARDLSSQFSLYGHDANA